MCVSGARIFDFTGALPHMLDQLPVAPRAGPFDLGWRSGRLFVTAAPLMKDAGRGAIEGFVTKLTAEVGFRGSVAREFMDVSEFASGAWFIANTARVVVKVLFLLGLGGGGAISFVLGVFARIPEYSAAFATSFCVCFGQRVLFRSGPAAGVCSSEKTASLVGQIICFVVTRCVGVPFDPFKRKWAGPADLTVEGVTVLGKFLIGMGFGDTESEVRSVV